MNRIIPNKKSFIKFAMLLLLSVGCLIFVNFQVNAATFTASAPSSIDANTQFTVSFGSGTTGQYSYSVTGGTIVSSSEWVENGGTLTVLSGSSGTVKVTITAKNVATSDYEDIAVGTSKTVSVTIKEVVATSPSPSPSVSPSPSASTTVVDTRSSDATLKSLSISGVELNPSFSSDTTDYTAELTDVFEINISASVNNSEASVSGTGTKSLTGGENVFKIVVTAEKGNQKTYTITIILNESPTIFFDYADENLGAVKDLSSVVCYENFDYCKLEHNGEELYGWYSTPLDTTIIYLVNDEEEAGFFVYENGEITSKFQQLTINNSVYFLLGTEQEELESGYFYENIVINDLNVDVIAFETDYFENYKILSLTNSEGVFGMYLYSRVDNSIITSPNFIPQNLEDYTELIQISTEQELSISSQTETINQLNTEIEVKISDNELQRSRINLWRTISILAIVLSAVAIALLVLKYKNIDVLNLALSKIKSLKKPSEE